MIWHEISTCAFMFQIWDIWSKFQSCTWNSLFGLHDKFISFSIKSSQIFMKRGDHAQNISKFTFELLDHFKHFQNSNYPLVTLHLPQPLTDGEDWKDDKMSSTHPNSNSSDVLDSISQEEYMSKNPFDILSLINCDNKTLILRLAKIYKLQYLNFCSSFKSEDRSRKL